MFVSLSIAAEKVPVELKGVGIEEHLGDRISLELPFLNENGESLPLRSFFHKNKPVILALVYYNCPNLCHYLMNGFSDSLRGLEWTVGKEFEVVVVSIDPTEAPMLAKQKKETYLKAYGRENISPGWHFLTGQDANIKKLANEIGFRYRYDTDNKEYAHSAAIYVLTTDGKISRYLYGVHFKPLDLKLSLMEASQGKIGNVVDKFLLFCYHYDPKSRKYAIFAVNLMKLGGVVVLLGLGILWCILNRRKR